MLQLVEQLVQRVIILPSVSMKVENYGFDIVNKILQLILCLIDDYPSAISEISVKWDPVFELRNSR